MNASVFIYMICMPSHMRLKYLKYNSNEKENNFQCDENYYIHMFSFLFGMIAAKKIKIQTKTNLKFLQFVILKLKIVFIHTSKKPNRRVFFESYIHLFIFVLFSF